MKQDIINKEPQERKAYVPASVKVIEVAAQRVICGSNEQYGSENSNPWA